MGVIMREVSFNTVFNVSPLNINNINFINSNQISHSFFNNFFELKPENSVLRSLANWQFQMLTRQIFQALNFHLDDQITNRYQTGEKENLIGNNDLTFPTIEERKPEVETIQSPPAQNPSAPEACHIKIANKVNKTYQERRPEEWKIFSDDQKAEFNYVAPVVNFDGLNLTEEEKQAVQERALKEFKASMRALDYSIADASLDTVADVQNNPELTETLNKFSDRTLDMYKAFLEVLQEEKAPFFKAEIGVAKSFGYSHEDIKNLIGPSKWYIKECDALKEKFLKEGISEEIAVACIHYLSENQYRNRSLRNLKNKPNETIAETGCKKKDLISALKNKNVAAAARKFCDTINGNPEGKEIKNLSKKFKDFGGSITTIENVKQSLALYDESQTLDLQDPRTALLEEIKSRLGDGIKEPGYIEPELMLNLLEGNGLGNDPVDLMRHKLYFIYKSKGIANEIAKSPEMIKKVNEKLAQRGWQINSDVCEYLRKHKEQPIFGLGSYAVENHTSQIRGRASPEQIQEAVENSPRLTWGEAEAAARRTDAVARDVLFQPFRYRMSPEEEMTYFASVFGRHHVTLLSPTTDRMAFERLLEASKRNERQPWIPGRNYFNVNNSSNNNCPYLEAVDALGLPQQAGISGSTDQTLTVAGMLGITSVEEIKRLRMMYLGWMTSSDDHSVDEILTSARSFGIDYTPSPDYYREIYPESPGFERRIAEGQARRGFKLPEYYLSKEYAAECLANLRKEKEAAQAEVVKNKLINNELFMRALVAKPEAKINDPFQDNTWNGFLRKLNNPKKSSSNPDLIKYTYNHLTGQMELHPKSQEPFYTGTNKLSVSLVPSHGKILPYKWDEDESVGLLFDRNGSEFKDKYIFEKDALTDNKWWRRFYTKEETEQPDFQEKLQRAVREIQSRDGVGANASCNHLRLSSMEELSARINKVAKFNEHNEILASLHKDKILGVFAFNKKTEENQVGAEYYTLLKGISKKIRLKEKEGVDVPLFVFDHARDKGLELYSTEKQAQDIQILKENKNGEFDALVSYLAAKSKSNKDKVASVLKKELARLEKYFTN